MDNDFVLDETPKAQAAEAKIDKWDHIKLYAIGNHKQ
jgi:hypothetical protein